MKKNDCVEAFKIGITVFLTTIINDFIWNFLDFKYVWWKNLLSYIIIYILVYFVIYVIPKKIKK